MKIRVPFAGLCLAILAGYVNVGIGRDWMVDAKTGCKIWNLHPQPNEGVLWSGACKGGYAHGRGVVQWLKDNMPMERDEGEWRDGRQIGTAIQVWPTGRYEGEVVNGEPHGRGVLTLPTLCYEGEFRNGKANGSRRGEIGM